MRIDEQKLLLRYARLMLRISIAKNPDAPSEGLEEGNVQLSAGYKKLRAFYLRLSDRRRGDFRRFMATTIRGVETAMEQAQASGEQFTLADIEIEAFDPATGQAVAAPTFGGED